MTIYILAKNEERNIEKCLRRFADRRVKLIVLDSGSTDRTVEITRACSDAEIRPFVYVNHCDAYNQITKDWTEADRYAMVLDADMEVSDALWDEIIADGVGSSDVLIAAINMYCEGRELRFGSLCPPKAFVFRGGRAYFQPQGHGEALKMGNRCRFLRNGIIHNDLKAMSAFLESQCRYAGNLVDRSCGGMVSWRDSVRLRCPIMAVLVPAYSLVVRGGIFSGFTGVLYAIDRAIAELICYRQALAARIRNGENVSVRQMNKT